MAQRQAVVQDPSFGPPRGIGQDPSFGQRQAARLPSLNYPQRQGSGQTPGSGSTPGYGQRPGTGQTPSFGQRQIAVQAPQHYARASGMPAAHNSQARVRR